MNYSYDQDKRIPPRMYPWWLILVGFVIGVVATLFFTASRWQPTVVYRYADDNAIWMQATMMVQQATLAANGYALQPPVEPVFATATAIIAEATAAAQTGAMNGVSADPYVLTATAIIAQATQSAPVNR